MRRVVITGVGMVSPLACGAEATWQRLIAGESGAEKITAFDVSDISAKIGCPLPRGDGSKDTFNPDDWVEPKEQRRIDDFIIFALAECGHPHAVVSLDFPYGGAREVRDNAGPLPGGDRRAAHVRS